MSKIDLPPEAEWTTWICAGFGFISQGTIHDLKDVAVSLAAQLFGGLL